ncbi:MAG: hypothetical protein IPL55_09960 [Saprospiraceae bacterium]|nr:hypothetical protein [Saprospiraceae bacterium]
MEIKNSFGLIDGRRDLFDDEKEWLKKTDNILFIFNFLNKIACKPTDLNILRDVYQNSQDRKLFKNEVIHELTLLLNPIKDKDIRKALNEEVISVFK